jgi:hypothetical protein
MLEAGKQHRCSEMHDLIWLLGISLGCLAGGEIREPGTVELELHQLRDGQLVVVEIGPMLETVARKMNEAVCLDPFGYSLHCCFSCNRLDGVSEVLRGGDRFDTRELFPDVPQLAQGRVLRTIFAHEEHLDVGGPDRWSLSLSPEKSRDSRSV